MDIQNNFIKGRMNKSLDERLLPPGEYVDALNVEVSSIEGTNIGSVKTLKEIQRRPLYFIMEAL